jgi:hypothetical protein
MFNNIRVTKNAKLKSESEEEVRGMKDGESAKLVAPIGIYMYTLSSQSELIVMEAQGARGKLIYVSESEVIKQKKKVQILCFGHYPCPVFIYKHHPVYFSKQNVSDNGFCLRLQVKPTQLGPIDKTSPYLRTPVPAPRWGIK